MTKKELIAKLESMNDDTRLFIKITDNENDNEYYDFAIEENNEMAFLTLTDLISG